MTYFELEPEVAGRFGPMTTGNLRARPPQLEKFNYEFDVWLGDPLLEAVSTFIVTDRLKERLIEARASGVAFGDVEVTKAGIFLDMNGDRPLPAFSWLQISGRAGTDDFGLSSSGLLVVSERVMVWIAPLRSIQIRSKEECLVAFGRPPGAIEWE
jgi:hypothetical protein